FTDLFQSQFNLGRPGRVVALLGLAADAVYGTGDHPELAQAHLDDAVRDRGVDDDVAFLHDDAPVRGEPLQSDRHSDAADFADSFFSARWKRAQSPAPGRLHGDPSADAVSRLRRFRRSICLRNGRHDHEAAWRYLDPHDTPLDDGRVDVPQH